MAYSCAVYFVIHNWTLQMWLIQPECIKYTLDFEDLVPEKVKYLNFFTLITRWNDIFGGISCNKMLTFIIN